MLSRQCALETLIDARPDELRQTCESLLDVRVLNATALRGLALYDDAPLSRLLVNKYRRFQPSDRAKVIEVLVSRRTSALLLLQAMDSDNSQIPPGDFTASHARQVLSLGDNQLTAMLSRFGANCGNQPPNVNKRSTSGNTS